MRTLTVLFALVASGLSIACLRLSSQLETERERLHEMSAQLRELRARSVRSPFVDEPSTLAGSAAAGAATTSATQPAIVRTPSRPQSNSRQADAATESNEIDQRGRYANWEEADRRMQADPKVGQLLETTTMVALRANHPELGRHLDLDPMQEDALLRVLARQELERQRLLRKLGTERETSKQDRAHQEELAAHLGGDRYQRFQSYQEKIPELLQVQELRNRTAKLDALSDYQSASLTSALNEERQRYLEELRRETWFGGMSGAYPTTVQINHAGLAEAVSAAERKIELSQAFYGRVQDRASTILTPSQQARLDQMVNEWVTQERLRLEWLRARNEVQASGAGRP
jgi:hypothetical protein